MENSQWISVDERLPEIGVNVLIYEPPSNYAHTEDKGIMAVSYNSGKKDKQGFIEFPDGQDEQPGTYNPTFWQPLPEPPSQLIHSQQEKDNWDKPMDN